jgi:hypothetical protein
MPTKRGQLLTGDNRGANVVEAKTMTELWNRANDSIIWADADDLAYASSLDSMITDCMGIARKATFDINIGSDLWVTPMRWNTLIRQYVDPDRLFQWLENVKDISTYKRGITALDMNPVKHQVVKSNARASRRKHGGCMRMVTYRAFPQPTLTLFSRTSYLGYIGGLDMLCAYKLIEQACDMIGDGLKPEQFQFTWVCDTWQFHGFKSMAYIFASGQDKFMRMSEERWERNVGRTLLINGVKRKLKPLDNYPTWKLIRYWWKRLAKQDAEGKLYEDMKYGAEKRIRRRFHAQTGIDQTSFLGDTHKAYPPLSTPIELITLDRMLYKTPESRAVIRKQKLEKANKLIDLLFSDDDLDILLLDNLQGAAR